MVKYVLIHIQAYTTSVQVLYTARISGNGEVIKYHIIISVVITELSAKIEVSNTGPEDRAISALRLKV